MPKRKTDSPPGTHEDKKHKTDSPPGTHEDKKHKVEDDTGSDDELAHIEDQTQLLNCIKSQLPIATMVNQSNSRMIKEYKSPELQNLLHLAIIKPSIENIKFLLRHTPELANDRDHKKQLPYQYADDDLDLLIPFANHYTKKLQETNNDDRDQQLYLEHLHTICLQFLEEDEIQKIEPILDSKNMNKALVDHINDEGQTLLYYLCDLEDPPIASITILLEKYNAQVCVYDEEEKESINALEPLEDWIEIYTSSDPSDDINQNAENKKKLQTFKKLQSILQEHTTDKSKSIITTQAQLSS